MTKPTLALLENSVCDLSDDELMAWINAGRAEEGLGELQRRYQSRIFHSVQAILHDPQLAQEVTHEVFCKVFLKSHLYQPAGNFQGWLFEVARNHALSLMRKRRRGPLLFSSLGAKGDGRDEVDLLQLVADHHESRELEERELMEAFEEAVSRLPERYRMVFDLCVRQGFSYKETACRLGVPTGTVAIRIMRARKRLYDELSRHLGRLRRPPACFE